MANLKKKKMTRREFLRASGKTAGLIGSTLAFPSILKSTALGETDTVKVGVIKALSGAYALANSEQTAGVQLAVEEINAEGGILGKKVEIFVRDDQLSPGVAATRTKELIEKEKVQFVIGGSTSATTPAIKEQTAPNKVIFMVGVMADSITAVPTYDRTIFHVSPTTYMFANVTARYAAENLGRKWYYLIADYAWGWDTFNSFSAVAKEYGGSTVGVSAHPLGASDFSPYINKILAAKPEVIILANGGRDQINAHKQLREFGAFEKSKVVSLQFDLSIILGAGVESVWDGYGGVAFYWQDEYDTTRKFVEAIMKKYNRVPSSDHAYGYEAMRELCSGIERAGSFDPEKIIKVMEEHRFAWVKGPEYWRKCDHQSIQDICVVTTKKPQKEYDIFQIVYKIGGEKIAKTCKDLGHKT